MSATSQAMPQCERIIETSITNAQKDAFACVDSSEELQKVHHVGTRATFSTYYRATLGHAMLRYRNSVVGLYTDLIFMEPGDKIRQHCRNRPMLLLQQLIPAICSIAGDKSIRLPTRQSRPTSTSHSWHSRASLSLDRPTSFISQSWHAASQQPDLKPVDCRRVAEAICRDISRWQCSTVVRGWYDW